MAKVEGRPVEFIDAAEVFSAEDALFQAARPSVSSHRRIKLQSRQV